jgi:hypothetical protein
MLRLMKGARMLEIMQYLVRENFPLPPAHLVLALLKLKALSHQPSTTHSHELSDRHFLSIPLPFLHHSPTLLWLSVGGSRGIAASLQVPIGLVDQCNGAIPCLPWRSYIEIWRA